MTCGIDEVNIGRREYQPGKGEPPGWVVGLRPPAVEDSKAGALAVVHPRQRGASFVIGP